MSLCFLFTTRVTSSSLRRSVFPGRFAQHPAFLYTSTYIEKRSRSSPLQHYNEQKTPRERDSNYSLNELQRTNERPFPPMLDSQHEDEEFGGQIHFDLQDEVDMIPADLREDKPKEQFQIPSGVIPLEVLLPERRIPRKEKSSARQPIEKSVIAKSAAMRNVNPKFAFGADSLDNLHDQVDKVSRQIYSLNNDIEFNLNSSRQVSQALFGGLTQSTKKDDLEEIAGRGNPMASLILDYRALKNRIKYISRQQNSILKGTVVKDAFSVVRPRIDTLASKDSDILDSVEVTDDRSSIHTTFPQKVFMQEELTDPLILMDASSYIFRAYYTMPPIHRSDGMPVGAVMGFCKMINSIFLSRMLSGDEPPRAVLCFDAKGKTFRHEMYPLYKGNRPAAPMDLIPQFDLIRQAAKAYGICQIEAPNYEADDVIATMARMAMEEGLDTNIVSGDKDLMQLVTEPDPNSPSVQMIDPVKKDRTTYNEVIEKWLVPPNKLGDVLALAGDTVDNVPGVPGIGPKIAASLINEFGSLDNLLENLDKIPQTKRRETLCANIDQARLSRDLVELNSNVPQHAMKGFPDNVYSVCNLRIEPLDVDRLLDFYDEMGFKELRRTLQEKVKGNKMKRPTSFKSKRPKGTIPKPEDYADVPF